MANSYNNIGVIYDYKSDFDKALKYYLKALNINLALYICHAGFLHTSCLLYKANCLEKYIELSGNLRST